MDKTGIVSYKEEEFTWVFFFAVLFLLQFGLFFVRGGWFADTDPYFLATAIKSHVVPEGYGPLFFKVLGFFQWDNSIPWIVPCFSAASMALLAGLFARHYANGISGSLGRGSSVKYGDWSHRLWAAFANHPVFFGALVCFGIPAFVFRGLIFEEDFFGLVFVFAALFCVLKHVETKERVYFWGHLFFLFVAFMIWMRGTVLFFPLFFLLSFEDRDLWFWWVPVGLIGVLLYSNPTIIPVPALNVAEKMPGILYLPASFLLVLGSIYEFKGAPLSLKIIFGYTFLFALYMYRFAILAVVPFAVLCYLFLLKLPDVKTVRFLGEIRPVPFFLQAILVGGFVAGVGGLVFVRPNPQEMADLQDVVHITGHELVANEWQWGHWLNYLGGNAEFSPLNNRDFIPSSTAKFVLGNCSLGYAPIKEYASFCLMRRAIR